MKADGFLRESTALPTGNSHRYLLGWKLWGSQDRTNCWRGEEIFVFVGNQISVFGPLVQFFNQ